MRPARAISSPTVASQAMPSAANRMMTGVFISSAKVRFFRLTTKT